MHGVYHVYTASNVLKALRRAVWFCTPFRMKLPSPEPAQGKPCTMARALAKT